MVSEMSDTKLEKYFNGMKEGGLYVDYKDNKCIREMTCDNKHLMYVHEFSIKIQEIVKVMMKHYTERLENFLA